MKKIKKIKLTRRDRRNLYMMFYNGGDDSAFEKFYHYTKTELFNLIRRIDYPWELCTDVVTEDIKEMIHAGYTATAELKLKGKISGNSDDFLLHMFRIANSKRKSSAPPEMLKKFLPR